MITQRYRISIITIAIIMALVGSGVLVPPIQTQASAILPNMSVTLSSGGSTYASTVYVGNSLIFRARVNNTGNVPLQVTANLTVPHGWNVDQNKYSDCPTNLAVGSHCTISWYFTPKVAGQVILRVYVRGHYKNSAGSYDSRITNSPAFIFNVKPPKGSK